MIFRRIFSIFFDLVLALIASIGAYLGGFDLFVSFVVIYSISKIVEVIYFKNQTLGMIVFSLSPKNRSSNDVSTFKMILYQIAFTLLIVNIFNPLVDIYTKIFLYALLLLPFYFKGKCNSFFDLFFNVNWSKNDNKSMV